MGKGNNYETRLWRPVLRSAFSNYDGDRAPLHEELDSLRLLRNRTAHARPIHHRHLAMDHERLLRVIGCLSADMVKFVEAHDRVPQALERRAGVLGGTESPSF